MEKQIIARNLKIGDRLSRRHGLYVTRIESYRIFGSHRKMLYVTLAENPPGMTSQYSYSEFHRLDEIVIIVMQE